ncbi:MAG: hypothetical protein MUF49_22135 [Oculatellaceae cyanobacterium Prado106]|jgi:hypothetical protein|nr:hypothetical protein [Oculatellaceae cyanobacterium Prado106]
MNLFEKNKVDSQKLVEGGGDRPQIAEHQRIWAKIDFKLVRELLFLSGVAAFGIWALFNLFSQEFERLQPHHPQSHHPFISNQG